MLGEQQKMKILVMGAGAIGSLFGGLLAEAGNEVFLVGRQPHISEIQNSGLKIKGFVDKHITNIKAGTTPSIIQDEDTDLVLLTVKAYDTKQATLQIKPLIKSRTTVLCLQNGIGVEEEAAKILGKTNLLRGVTFCGAFLKEPGTVFYTGFGETIIGRLNKNQDEVEEIVKTFKNAGFPTKISENIQTTVWTKTLVNAGINPFGTLTEMKNGELIKNREIRTLMVNTVEEGIKVAKKLKVPLKEDPVKLMLKTAEATANNLNSMLQDIKRGKKTEIDYINGAISKLGKKLGVPTPLNSLLTFLIKILEEKSCRREVIHIHPTSF